MIQNSAEGEYERHFWRFPIISLNEKLYSLTHFSPLPCGLVRCSDLHLQFANTSWLDTMAMSREMFGKPMEIFWPELLQQQNLLKDSLAEKTEKTFKISSVPFSKKENTRLYFDLFIKNVTIEEGPAFWCMQVLNVTDQINMCSRLEAERIKAEAASREKSMFLAKFSHEIRNPIGLIAGYNHLIKNSYNLDSEIKKFFEVIDQSTENVTNMLEDILDISRVESGKMKIQMKSCSVTDIFHEIERVFCDQIQKKGLKFELDLSPSLPQEVKTDPCRFRQILTNVIGNSVKFTSHGGIKVRVDLEKKESKFLLHTLVTDTGIGMTEQQASQLFKLFSRLDNGQNIKGTGLGLALSQNLSRAMGGDIKVVNCEPEVGCQFLITIAVEIPQNAQQSLPKESFSRAYGEFNSWKILAVEDSLDNQIYLQYLFSKSGAKIEFVDGGIDALQKIQFCDFDIILMDMGLPGMDGYEVTRALRERGFNRPIIALTGYAMPEDLQKSFEAGCDAYLTKPVNASLLFQTLKQFRDKESNLYH